VLDSEGWTPVNGLLDALNIHYKSKWHQHLNIQDLEDMIAGSDKVRFELKNDKIRALYGHSCISSNLVGKIYKKASKPPSILYHGTSSSSAKNIMSEGIRSMNRQYVHLSTDKKTAIQVAKRKVIQKKEEHIVIITISSMEAHIKGANFYQASDLVWLADYIHPDFLYFEFIIWQHKFN
ncbi:MAG: RNA 2'-phosphotransferase, partial [Thermoproteota archaeon]|nr:RNA 2'-phosphotransferase [Thermoproteota archaeon]